MNKIIPDSDCKQGKCARATSGCVGECWLKTDSAPIFTGTPSEEITRLSARVAELEAKVPKWISVEDRLPEERDTCDGRVAALDAEGVAVVGIRCADAILTGNGKAIHWMPLPAAPGAEK